jgi:hypothetical protein
MKIEDIFNDKNMAICGIITLLAVGAAVLLDHFYPVSPQYPKMFKSDESLKSKTV